ncbi:MAG: NF038143 family protein [Planctomycetota bacterium]|jgi:hypothetical protein
MRSVGLKKKYDIILARERNLARSVALEAIKPKPFSVWEVMIPIVFILGYMRSKEQREVFSQNVLFTKKLALEAAYDMIQKNTSREAVIDRIKSKTDQLLSSVPANIYSKTIRQEQLKEIDLLIDHYSKVIQAEGEDYSSLVAGAYHNRDEFKAFQTRLKSAEEKVAQAARQTLGGNTDSAMAARIEQTVDKLRMAEAEKIFGPQGKR